ncbi:beta-N-acetylhexosaminidase [Ectothiorhodospiraceae bacterium WFHF3C12]|nr:beta-N-acetylhexosaminidase [Ectothiorhodospiraceae bacterium WFHF3C12]
MTLGPLMVGIAGPSLSVAERRILRHPRIGGVILFSRNFESPAQLRALTGEIHGLRSPPLLVGVDQEGGRVQRFRDPLTDLPPVARLGAAYDADPRRACALAESTGWLMAAELRALGVDLSFAPVLDLGRGVSGVIGDRAFHHSPPAVVDLALAYVRGMRRAGMAATGKHYPGHGSVAADSHLELPVDDRPYADIEASDLRPFERLVANDIPALMAAHVVYPQVDAVPASFSPVWIRQILRGRLGYQGCVVGDDLEMAGAAGFGALPERAAAGAAAGQDLLLLCNALDAVTDVADALPEPAPESGMRLARLHGTGGQDWEALPRLPAWRAARAAVAEYDHDRPMELDL